MQVSELEKWGIPSRVIEKWRQRQGETLLPVQSRVVERGLLGSRYGNGDTGPVRMIISAPTSSGKSFCAEMAAIKALTARQKTVMLFPLKSLAEQKQGLFEKTYGELGIKCLIVTGDHPENVRPFLAGDFQIAVVIYEKFDLLLTSSLDALKNIGLVVVDEIQSISESGRGAVLERLLTKILASVYNPSLLGLSAVIGSGSGSAGTLARWLGASLVEERIRPVELKRGVATEGSFRYRLFNDGSDGVEPFGKPQSGDGMFETFAAQIKDSPGSTLIFLKSRMETVDYAFKLAASVNWPEARQALADLKGEESSFLMRSLRRALSRSVAFHNSDLSLPQRRAIEQAFADKDITVLFSTTTLAMGVDLPADTVYLETVKYTSGEYNERPSLMPVTRAEFDNMTGRAGRLRAGDCGGSPGRAVVMAENEFDRDVLWKNYIAPENPEPVRSAFGSMPLTDWLLDLIAAGLVSRGGEESPEALRRTFHCATDGDIDSAQVTAALKILGDEGLVETDQQSGRLAATAVGRATALSGLSVRQAVYYQRKLAAEYPHSDAGWIALALSAPEWSLPPSMLSRVEHWQNIPLKMLYQNFDHLVEEAAFLLGQRSGHKPLTYRQAASVKALLLLEQWRRLAELERLEERFQIHLGQIVSLGETAAHLMLSIADLIEAAGRDESSTDMIRTCAFSVRYGIPPTFGSIHERFGQMLTRSDFGRLNEAGLTDLPRLCEADPDTVRGAITEESKAIQMIEAIESLRKEFHMQTNAAVKTAENFIAPPVFAKPELIEIDGTFHRERYLVRINGFPVRLTGKSFKYFAKLAWSRLNRESGWIYKEDIEVGFNQARYLYRMKGEINACLANSWPVIENNRLGYYRLDAERSRIRINLENLKNHPDYEVRALVSGEANQAVN